MRSALLHACGAPLSRLGLGLLLSVSYAACSLSGGSTGADRDTELGPVGHPGEGTTEQPGPSPSPLLDASMDAQEGPGQPPSGGQPGGGAAGGGARDGGPLDGGRTHDAASPIDAGGLDASLGFSPDAATGDASPSPGPSACTFEGPFALRAELDVSWVGTSLLDVIPVLAPGAGKLTIYASSRLNGSDPDEGLAFRACDLEIPDFQAGNPAVLSEVYGAELPEEAFDQPTMPTSFAASEFGCFQPGCAFQTGRLEPLLGAPTRASANSFWNSESSSAQAIDARDDDADGAPGVTLRMRGPDSVSAFGVPYSYPPLGLVSLARASRIMLAMGVRARLSGALESCDVVRGDVLDGEVRTRAVGATAFRDSPSNGIETLASHVRFLDENLPQWQVRSGTFRAVRIPDASCAAVRAAFE